MKVIKRNQLPSRLPLSQTLLAWLALDFWNAPGWVWGVVGTLVAIIWIVAIILLIKEEETEIKL